MRAVAQGLSEFLPSFRRFAEVQNQQEQERQTAAGKSYAQSMRDYEREVREGRMAPIDNPWWQLGYRQGKGIVDAQRFGERLRADYQTWEGRQGEDANAVQGWIDQRMQAFLGDANDQTYLQGFQQVAQSVRQQLGEEHTRTVRENVANRGREQVVERIRNEAGGILSDGRTSLTDAAPKVTEVFHRAGFELRRFGYSGEEVNAILMQSLSALTDVTNRANPADSVRLIEAVAFAPRPDDQNPGRTLPGFGSSPRALEQLRVLRDRAMNEMERRESRAERAAARADRQARRDGDRLLDSIFFQGANVSPEDIRAQASRDPGFLARFHAMNETITRQREHSEDRARSQQSEQVFNGFIGRLLAARSADDLTELRADVVREVAMGSMRGPDAGRLLDDIRRSESDPSVRPQSPLGSTEYSAARSFLQQSLQSRFDDPLMRGLGPNQTPERIAQAQQQLAEQTMRWYYDQWREGKRPTGQDIFTFSNDAARRLVESVSPQAPSVGSRSGAAASPPSSPQARPQQPQTRQETPADPVQRLRQVATQRGELVAVGAALNSDPNSPSVRQWAQQNGLDPSNPAAIRQEIAKRLRELRNPTP
ncbi:hypothetical protein NON00_02295 [Roseomonas sp. GC11]|uniref:hypothetical protein n=1 Tax=Roseomonas sp. GC11 TaxID=2950546 RepID=UPI00210B8288|nr:hypothetical protein [Roseomonas sp. GC11]MCQ4158757.1 hypothetical protein [Roseomonas sp. GC11]